MVALCGVLLLAACSSSSPSASAEGANVAGVGGAGSDQGSPTSPGSGAGGQRAGGSGLGTSGAGARSSAEPGAGTAGSNAEAAGQGGDQGGLAYMVGIKTNGDSQGPAKVEAWLGRPLDLAGSTITTVGYIGSGGYEAADGTHPLLEVSFPLLSIFNEPNQLNDLARAAAGDYDTTYEAMAQALAGWPNPLLSARIGWEFNGDWYAWSNGVSTNATYANYVSAFQHAAIAIRKYNPRALIQWCVAWGQPDPTPYWPGAYDAVSNPGGVDVISMDFYQANISHYNNAGKQSSWAMVRTIGGIDLDWMAAFARSKDVKIALSEYAAGGPGSAGQESGPGLDDGAWTADAIGWMNAQPAGFFLWSSWSDDGPGDDIVTAGANPQEQAAWKAAWHGTHFAGRWWH